MPFSTFLRLQGDHHCACAQKWCHFSFFPRAFKQKKDQVKYPLFLLPALKNAPYPWTKVPSLSTPWSAQPHDLETPRSGPWPRFRFTSSMHPGPSVMHPTVWRTNVTGACTNSRPSKTAKRVRKSACFFAQRPQEHLRRIPLFPWTAARIWGSKSGDGLSLKSRLRRTIVKWTL